MSFEYSLNATRSQLLGVSSSSNKDVPDRAAVLCLLGHLCRGARCEADARKYYQECLKLSPFMWEAFEAFCQMGLIKADRERNPEEEDIDPDLIFRTNKEHMLRAPCTDIQNSRKVTSTSTPMFTRGEKGYHITRRAKNLGLKVCIIQPQLPLRGEWDSIYECFFVA